MAVSRLFVLFVICLGIGNGEEEYTRIYVSVTGTTDPGCGRSRTSPCATLSNGFAEVDGGIEIFLLSPLDETDEVLCEINMINVSKPLRVVGEEPGVRIGCEGSSEQYDLLKIEPEDKPLMRVHFENLFVINSLIKASSINVSIVNCTFENSKLKITPVRKDVGFNMVDSTWIGYVLCNETGECQTSGELIIEAGNLKFAVRSSHFYQTHIDVTSYRVSTVDLDDTVVSSQKWSKKVHAGFLIKISNKQGSNVTINNCLFENQLNPDPILAVRNLYEAAVLVRSLTYRGVVDSNVSLAIRNSVFRNNERGLTLIGAFDSITVDDSLFEGNVAMHAGAGVLSLTTPNTTAYFTNTTFDSNAAGSYRKEIVEGFKDSFSIRGNEVRVYSECCKGVISFVGKGGAVRAQKGHMVLRDCTFQNNTASLLGGAIFVDRESTVKIFDVDFSNSERDLHSLQGDILYSNGKVELVGTRLYIKAALNHVAVLRHSGDHWTMNVTRVQIHCPVGHRLRVTNTSAYGVMQEGLRRSYLLDQLSYYCESCPRNRYSLDHGYLKYNSTNREFDYFTLLINGSEPKTTYPGTSVYQDISCIDCPYGGKCLNGITAVPNFWGYQHRDNIKFQHCPKGYCCTSTQCDSYNTCAAYRTGPLCSECIRGYSEALFSSHCVPDDTCDSTWLWPFALASGAIYTLFLLFQKDARDFMLVHPMQLKDIRKMIRTNSSNRKPRGSDDEQSRSPLQGKRDEERFAVSNNVILLTERPQSQSSEIEHESTPPAAEAEKPAAPDTGATFLIILFYYFQDAQLLHVKTVFASAENKSKGLLKVVLSGLFKFRLELFHFMERVCFVPGMKPSTKLLVKALLVPYVIILFMAMYFVYRLYLWNHRRGASMRRNQNGHVTKQEGTEGATEEAASDSKTFLTRLCTGFMLAMLFTYQKLATTSFALLNCVPISGRRVLFIDATVDCYEIWQLGVMGYAGGCLVLFSLVLLIGPGLIKDQMISIFQFFTGCIFPPPFILYWLGLRLSGRKPKKTSEGLSQEATAVITVLQGPFKEIESRWLGPLCGAGILIGRRLVLVLLFTFVNDTLVRLLCMMLVCFIILLHHVHALPYKDLKGNLAGSASAAALLIVGGLNLVRAGFEAAEYIPQGPNATLMQVFEEIENILMLWFPLGVMIIIILCLNVKIILLILKRILMHSKTVVPTTDENRTTF